MEIPDLDSTEGLIAAINFSIFPVCLSCIITLPAYLMNKGASLGFIGFFIVSAVAYTLWIFVYAVSQFFAAKIFRGQIAEHSCAAAAQ